MSSVANVRSEQSYEGAGVTLCVEPTTRPRGVGEHPHRGFETVTIVYRGEVAHRDSSGGGGQIGPGDVQWMTAASGILHDEVPTETFRRNGGRTHGVQLWVNLPAALKMSPPRYQAITGDALALATSADGGALVRLIAGDLAGRSGPGSTHTPITYAHVSLSPGAQLIVPWNPAFNALAYVLAGHGTVGSDARPVGSGQLVVFGDGDSFALSATGTAPLEVLLLGGQPIRGPVAAYGPFVMNTRAELVQAVEDFNAGRLGTIPQDGLRPYRRH